MNFVANVLYRLENVWKVYTLSKTQEIPALQDINLEIYEKEYLVILGPSGSGKTTLLNLLGTLDFPTQGTIYFNEIKLSDLQPAELASFRTYYVGFIFQRYNLIQHLTALENVMLPMVFSGINAKTRKQRAISLLEKVGLKDRLNHLPSELSGGQQQRVAIARALANNPKVILADEPTANLDLVTGLKITNLLHDLSKDFGVTVINTTHDLKLIDVADRICWVDNGKIERIEKKMTVELTKEELPLEMVL